MKIDLDKFKELMQEKNPEQYYKLYPEAISPEQIVDPIINAFETLAKATVESDRSLLNLVQALTDRLITLEDKVNLLLMQTKGEN